MKKIKLVYQDKDGLISELTVEVNEKDLANIGQCFRNIYGWVIQDDA